MADHPLQTVSTTIFFDGELIPAEAARVPIDDRALQFGLGFFETFRTSGGRPHLWHYHARRLQEACGTAHLRLPEWFLGRDPAWLDAIVQRLLQANGATDAVFRYTVTAGPEAADSGDGPVELLVPRLLPPPAPADGVTLRVLNLARDNGEWLPRPKSLNYSNALLGRQELRDRAALPSDEGLFLSRESGVVVETTHQNIGWFRDGCLYYPDPAVGCVAGTCLAWLLDLGIVAAPRFAPLEEMLRAEAIIVFNSVRGITPVRAVYGRFDELLVRAIPSASHPCVLALQQRWSDALRRTVAG